MSAISNELWTILIADKKIIEDEIIVCIDNYPEYCSIRFNNQYPIERAILQSLSATVIKRMLEYYPSCCSEKLANGNYLLHSVISVPGNGYVDIICAIIDLCPEAVSMNNTFGNIPILVECRNLCRYDVIVKLLSIFPDGITAVNISGSFPLHLALLSPCSNLEIITYLINLYTTAVCLKNDYYELPLHIECKNHCRYEVLVKLLSIYPEAIRDTCHSSYPLHLTIKNSNISITSLQHIYHGYPEAIKQCDYGNHTPVYYAVNMFYNNYKTSTRFAIKLNLAKIKYLLAHYPEAIYEGNELIIDIMNIRKSNFAVYRLLCHISSSVLLYHPPHMQLYHDMNWKYRSPLLHLLLQTRSRSYHITINNHHTMMIYTLLLHMIDTAGGKVVTDEPPEQSIEKRNYDIPLCDDLGQTLLRHIVSWL